MNIAESKISLIQYIMSLNENDKIKKLMDFIASEDSRFVAWDVNGNPYTSSMYRAAIEQANESIDKGEYKTTEELRKKYINA